MHPLLIEYSVIVRVLLILLCTVLSVGSIQIAKSDFNVDHEINKFEYEKMHHYGKGRRIIQDYRRINPFKSYGYEHPNPLPPPPEKLSYPSQWSAFTQGQRKSGDKRVFSKKFHYKARSQVFGHKYFIDGVVECIISAVVLDTEGATPVKLRGGVGYNYFAFVVLAKAGEPLKGQLQAFCQGTEKKIGRGGQVSPSVETEIDRDI